MVLMLGKWRRFRSSGLRKVLVKNLVVLLKVQRICCWFKNEAGKVFDKKKTIPPQKKRELC